ncbi:MAG: cob(I)yrinic acid a,c-diamide adenosyltransferase [Alicyclobacillus herbarius]|uniref:cob(I)yrinic acid a,c-diamide adenosyltransferase n=1 Tax=Alicyclobacillus herbarius TaxID=122960 RepID=UPI0023532FDB|nr:cob(I)yrinic acid a,c-diamide adenosyltransferase [Alicyclobacillus herbarius]MCL6631914.1 cob(I)yrinic acid a,c-diamide adenosyltransferase [Alicyclobacillus herbarius]
MRIYTRGGDRGQTTLIGRRRRFKSDVRVEAYGAVDEAGAFLGLAASYLRPEQEQDILDLLAGVQQRLWDVGADLAAPADAGFAYRTPDTAAADLEPAIDHYQAEAEKLTQFIIRGGDTAAAALHVACTVVRRAERRAVALMQQEEIHQPALRYLNRLSDLLFVLARAVNARRHVQDVVYEHSGHVFHSPEKSAARSTDKPAIPSEKSAGPGDASSAAAEN